MTLNKNKTHKGLSHFSIVKILKKFSPVEIKEFEKLLISPFYNNHSTIVILFEEIKKYYPDFSANNITKEYLFQIVNKGKKYDDKVFRKYLSRLNKLAEEYLNILQMRSEKYKRELNVLFQLSKRDINDVYLRKVKEIKKSFAVDNKLDGDKFLLKHFFSTIRYDHETTGDNIESKSEELVESYNNLVNYFLFFSTSILNQLDSNQYSFKSTHSDNSLKILLDSSKIEQYTEDVKKLKTPDNEDRIFFLEIVINDMKLNSSVTGLRAFKNLKQLVYRNSEKLSDQVLFYLLQRMNVFCIIESAKGNLDMNRDIFENYKMIFDKNLFNLDRTSYLSLLDLRLILSSSLKSNEFDWTEKFISEKLHLLKEELRVNVRHFSYATLSFYKKNYTDALSHISKIKSESSPITKDIYVLKAKIFYELGHYDSALSVADSFRHYVLRSNIFSDFHKETILNFLKYYKLIIRLTNKPDRAKIQSQLSDLQIIKNTKEKKWMVEKIEELLLKTD